MSPHNPTGMGTYERPTGSGVGWLRLFDLWDAIKVDLHESFGVDLDRPAAVSWHWVVSRVTALLTAPVAAYRPDGYALAPNRLLASLYPPPPPKH